MSHQPAQTLLSKQRKSRAGANKAAITKAARKVIQLRREHKDFDPALDELDAVIKEADA